MRFKYFRACSVFFGLSFVGGLFWSIFSITTTHDNEQIVAGVGLFGISAIGVSSFLTYFLLATNRQDSDVIPIEIPKNIPDSVLILIYEGNCVNIATSEKSPPKFVVFEPES